MNKTCSPDSLQSLCLQVLAINSREAKTIKVTRKTVPNHLVGEFNSELHFTQDAKKPGGGLLRFFDLTKDFPKVEYVSSTPRPVKPDIDWGPSPSQW